MSPLRGIAQGVSYGALSLLIVIAHLTGHNDGVGAVRNLVGTGILLYAWRIAFGVRRFYVLPLLSCAVNAIVLALTWKDITSQPSDSEIGIFLIVPIMLLGVFMYYAMMLLGMVVAGGAMRLMAALIGEGTRD